MNAMNLRIGIGGVIIFTMSFVVGWGSVAIGNSSVVAAPAPQEDVPAYHKSAAAGLLPATLSPREFPDGLNQNVYALAAKVKRVLYQQPCYCHCDRAAGHTSLLDCFRDTHGAICAVCKAEAVYSYEQTKKGKTPAQIREGIMRGEWKSLDLTKYNAPMPAK